MLLQEAHRFILYLSEANTSYDVGLEGVSDEIMQPLDEEIVLDCIFEWILDDFGIALEYQVIGILNLSDLSSICWCFACTGVMLPSSKPILKVGKLHAAILNINEGVLCLVLTVYTFHIDIRSLAEKYQGVSNIS